jgi:hypothetical protein
MSASSILKAAAVVAFVFAVLFAVNGTPASGVARRLYVAGAQTAILLGSL